MIAQFEGIVIFTSAIRGNSSIPAEEKTKHSAKSWLTGFRGVLTTFLAGEAKTS